MAGLQPMRGEVTDDGVRKLRACAGLLGLLLALPYAHAWDEGDYLRSREADQGRDIRYRPLQPEDPQPQSRYDDWSRSARDYPPRDNRQRNNPWATQRPQWPQRPQPSSDGGDRYDQRRPQPDPYGQWDRRERGGAPGFQDGPRYPQPNRYRSYEPPNHDRGYRAYERYDDHRQRYYDPYAAQGPHGWPGDGWNAYPYAGWGAYPYAPFAGGGIWGGWNPVFGIDPFGGPFGGGFPFGWR